jgi:ribosomal-protein-alanine N-acetyltransferase
MTPSGVVVREPRAADAAACVAIERASFGDPWSEESFQRLVTVQREHLRVAEQAGTVVGYWVGSRVDDEAELANLAVDPARRGAGIGAQLLDHFLRHVAAGERTVVFLEVRASNAPALHLYASRGFEIIAQRARYYSNPVEDAFVMAREPRPV